MIADWFHCGNFLDDGNERTSTDTGLEAHRQLCSLNFRQRTSFVHGDVISFVALDLILRITFSGVMHVTFVLHVVRVYLDDIAFNVSGFGVPSDMVSNRELLYHSPLLSRHGPIRRLVREVAGPHLDAAVVDLTSQRGRASV